MGTGLKKSPLTPEGRILNTQDSQKGTVSRFFGMQGKAELVLIAVCAIVIIFVACWIFYKVRDDSITIGTDDKIEVTPTMVQEMKSIGQWEFLAISDEELVDTVRKGFFSDDELVRIYYGTARIGIDFSEFEDNWVTIKGDSIELNLPGVELLDDNILDETRTKSFFETGKWTNADRKAMAERARAAMKARCLSEANKNLAQQNAEQEVRKFIKMIIKKD